MKAAIVVMTILGCGHGETDCEFVKTVDTEWFSQAECRTQTETHLKASADVNYPSVIAVCSEKPQPFETVEETATPAIRRDVVVREADVLDRIYDSLPDFDDAQAGISGLIGLTRSGVSQVSRWFW